MNNELEEWNNLASTDEEGAIKRYADPVFRLALLEQVAARYASDGGDPAPLLEKIRELKEQIAEILVPTVPDQR